MTLDAFTKEAGRYLRGKWLSAIDDGFEYTYVDFDKMIRTLADRCDHLEAGIDAIREDRAIHDRGGLRSPELWERLQALHHVYPAKADGPCPPNRPDELHPVNWVKAKINAEKALDTPSGGS